MKLPSLKPNRLPSLQSNQPTLTRSDNYGQGRGGRPWRRIKAQVHERDLYTCQQCGRVTMELECDHIVNQAQGGTDDLNNLQSLCKDCHSKKTQTESKIGQGRL